MLNNEDKRAKLSEMLNGRKDAYCYTVNEHLYIIGKSEISQLTVVKNGDEQSAKLFSELRKAQTKLENSDYNSNLHKEFLGCYSKLVSYNRFRIISNGPSLSSFFEELHEDDVNSLINQITEYQQMYFCHINGFI